MKSTNGAHAKAPLKAIAIRSYFARKILLLFALTLGIYLALIPFFHRLAD